MNRPQVFIPSRGRPQNARKLTQAWHKEGFDVHWIVEPDEHDVYFDKIVGDAPISGPPGVHPESTFVTPLPVSNQGISYSRNFCVRIAADLDLRSIILADDDIKPGAKGGNMLSLAQAAEHHKVLGITARYSYHDLCLGLGDKQNKFHDHYPIGRLHSLILLPTGTFRLVALNVQNVMDIGNYDPSLEYAEDCDLFLRGLTQGYPWLLHAGTWSSSIGKRYEPGGMVDYALSGNDTVDDLKPFWHQELHDLYPEFTNEHTDKCKGKQNCIRISWRKAYDTLIPNWRKYSDLHGGRIENYLDA